VFDNHILKNVCAKMKVDGDCKKKKKTLQKQYLLTLMLFQTSMCLFFLLYTKEDIWKNVLIKQISFPIDCHCRKKCILW